MTVVRNGGLIPLPNRPVVVIEALPHAASLAEEGSPSGATLAQALADLGAEVAAYYITPEVTSEEYEKTTELVERCGLVIMVTQNAHRCARQAELARLVAERCPEHVFIGTRTPYELGICLKLETTLQPIPAAPKPYGPAQRCFWGEAKGRLPVTLLASLREAQPP